MGALIQQLWHAYEKNGDFQNLVVDDETKTAQRIAQRCNEYIDAHQKPIEYIFSVTHLWPCRPFQSMLHHTTLIQHNFDLDVKKMRSLTIFQILLIYSCMQFCAWVSMSDFAMMKSQNSQRNILEKFRKNYIHNKSKTYKQCRAAYV